MDETTSVHRPRPIWASCGRLDETSGENCQSCSWAMKCV